MFFSVNDLDLAVLPFARVLSSFMIKQEGDALCIALTGDRRLARIAPPDGRPCSYRAGPRAVELYTKSGPVRFAISESQVMRAEGLTPVTLIPQGGCVPEPFENGCVILRVKGAGNLLIVPIAGSAVIENGAVSLRPGPEGHFDCALHDFTGEPAAYESYMSVEDVLDDAELDYNDWLSRYGDSFPEYEEVKRLAAYIVWSNVQRRREDEPGFLKNHLVFTGRGADGRAVMWEQALNALAVMKNPGFAGYMLSSAFAYQREDGALPSSVTDDGARFDGACPPIHSIAVYSLMDAGGGCDSLYEPLKRYLDWWRSTHWSERLNLPVYVTPADCVSAGAPRLRDMLPLATPDLAAYMALLLDALGRIARSMGRDDEAEQWERRSDTLIKTMIDRLWDGRRFFARDGDTGEAREIYPTQFLLPIVMGDERLPRDIFAACAAEIGARLVPGMGVADFRDGDTAWLPHQVFMAVALSRWGYQGLAVEIAREVLEYVDKHGFSSTARRFDPMSPQQAAPDWDTAAAAAVLNLVNCL